LIAFTLVEKYTGMAIGDVAMLRLDALNGNALRVNRKKTGEPVYTNLPDFAVAALRNFRPDSNEFFFWSGEGELHTRTSKWGQRIQKLFAAAKVRVTDEEKTRRSGGELKDEPEIVTVSKATPHWWRHTFVRDCYARRPQPVPLETIADLIGDDVKTVRKYYSSFDELRQEQLKEEMSLMWAADPLTQRLMDAHTSSAAPTELPSQGKSRSSLRVDVA
jgi:integrase